jgi:hypothetical protein
MLLCGWLFEDPDAVNDFLGEGSSVPSLINASKVTSSTAPLVAGLCIVLLSIIYEFSSKDSPVPRSKVHALLVNSLGREFYIDRLTKLRENVHVRDFEVLPQSSIHTDGGLPNVFFDQTFVDFLKDNFSRLQRAVDRDPGFEVSVMANGVQKGKSLTAFNQRGCLGSLRDRRPPKPAFSLFSLFDLSEKSSLIIRRIQVFQGNS